MKALGAKDVISNADLVLVRNQIPNDIYVDKLSTFFVIVFKQDLPLEDNPNF